MIVEFKVVKWLFRMLHGLPWLCCKNVRSLIRFLLIKGQASRVGYTFDVFVSDLCQNGQLVGVGSKEVGDGGHSLGPTVDV